MALAALFTVRNAAIAVVSIILAGAATTWAVREHDHADKTDRFALGGKVKRLSGDHLKLKDGRSVEFAALRLPYEAEPCAEQSRRTLTKWITDEGVRLQFDGLRDQKHERILAYVYANDTFINERLVRDGLAFVKLRSGNLQHAETLLAAQGAARDEHKGIWNFVTPTTEGEYLGDELAATFHRATCEQVRDKSAMIKLIGTADAFDRGMTPCGHCRPLSDSGK